MGLPISKLNVKIDNGSDYQVLPVSDLTTSLIELEYAYNVLSLFEQYYHDANVDFQRLTIILEGRQEYGLQYTNLRLREMLSDHRLLVVSVTTNSPIKFSFKGLYETTKILAEIFDPIARKSRKEDLKHSETMHRLSEEERRIKVLIAQIKQIEALRKVADECIHRSRKRYADGFDQAFESAIREVAWTLSKQISQTSTIETLSPEDRDHPL